MPRRSKYLNQRGVSKANPAANRQRDESACAGDTSAREIAFDGAP